MGSIRSGVGPMDKDHGQQISIHTEIYRKFSNIRRTKSQNLNDSHLVLHFSLPNLLKPGVK